MQDVCTSLATCRVKGQHATIIHLWWALPLRFDRNKTPRNGLSPSTRETVSRMVLARGSELESEDLKSRLKMMPCAPWLPSGYPDCGKNVPAIISFDPQRSCEGPITIPLLRIWKQRNRLSGLSGVSELVHGRARLHTHRAGILTVSLTCLLPIIHLAGWPPSLSLSRVMG